MRGDRTCGKYILTAEQKVYDAHFKMINEMENYMWSTVFAVVLQTGSVNAFERARSEAR